MFTLVKKNPFCCGGLAPMLLFVALVLSAMVFSCRLEAQAAGQEVGLVTGVSGDVTYENESDQEEPANVQAFMKIRKGDRFKVHTGGMIQLVYFSNGRQETWKGHLTLVAGDGETKVRKNEADVQPEVKTLPTTVAQALGSSSMPLPRSVPTSGAVQIPSAVGSTRALKTRTRAPTLSAAFRMHQYGQTAPYGSRSECPAALAVSGVFAGIRPLFPEDPVRK